MAGLPHQRLPAQLGDAVVQRLAGLHVGNDRRAGILAQHRFSQNGQKLIAPDHPALPVDRPDAVAIAVEGQSEIEVLLRDQGLEVRQILLFGGIGMMIGETAVHIGEQRMMLTGQELHQLLDHRPRRAIAAVPADAEAATRIACEQAPDIIVENIGVGDGALALIPVTLGRHAPERLDVGPKKRTVLKHHLEAVIIAGIVAASYLDAAIHFQRGFGIIEHRRRSEADPHHIAARSGQPFDQCGLQHRGRDAPVTADRNAMPARAAEQGGKAAPDRARIVRPQRLAHDSANVIFAQRGRIETMGHWASMGNATRFISRASRKVQPPNASRWNAFQFFGPSVGFSSVSRAALT